MFRRTWLLMVGTGLVLLGLATGGGLFSGAEATRAAGDAIPGQYIIVLRENAPAADAAPAIAREHGLGLGHVYGHALNGFAARVPDARLAKLRADPRVLLVEQDRVVTIDHHCVPGNARHNNCTPTRTPTASPTPGAPTATSTPPANTPTPTSVASTPTPTPTGGSSQVIPTGVRRINGTISSTAAGDGTGDVNIAVAVIDTGIASHVDLNIAGGRNCSSGSSYSDGNGHGTHVAGTIGARDNSVGVVGVAPGARLWAVRVLNDSGSGSWSNVICGLDWVTANASVIDVANLSLGGSGLDGSCASSALHSAICRTVNAGVTVVVAAGNSAADSATYVPATYPEVITVSALADFDGLPGGLGSPTCRTDTDDTFANFSNYGADVDLIAPGVCILSTWLGGGYNTISGTSMASPHVAGAAALYLSRNPAATPAQVKAALQAAGSLDWNAADDGDGTKEALLAVSGF